MNFDLRADLTVIWAFIIVLAVFIYVFLGGFDLGIGILFRRFAVGQDRDTAMNSIAPRARYLNARQRSTRRWQFSTDDLPVGP